MNELDPDVLHRYASEKAFPGRYFYSAETERCFKVTDGVYFNHDCSTDTKCYIIKKVFERSGIAESDLSFELYRSGASE